MKEQPGARIELHDTEPHRGVSQGRERIAEASPRRLARIAGSLGLINIVFGAIAFVPDMLVVPDMATTAHNIQTHELLYRFGLAAHLVICVTNVLSTVIFYDLFKVVNRRLALLDVFFTLVATSVEATSLLLQVVPLVLLGSGPYASALPAAQLQALAYLPGDLSKIDYSIYGILYGVDWIIVAYLVFRSTFLPRTIGVLLAIDGIAYLVYGFADLLAPGFAAYLVPWIQSPSLLSEGSFYLWLLIVGVNVERWKERASAASRMRSTEVEATTMKA
ncbi:MAG TPA: DUF4386 domain-containing protein [Ktedonosporobacter sp.]|nr:DUF4386 domain-containing protein [Ktedonosporobacter sp.]